MTMSFIVKDKQLLKNYTKIWDKIEKLMKINFESNLVYGDEDKYINIQKKIYADSIVINFYYKKMLKEKEPFKCLSMMDSVIKANKKYTKKIKSRTILTKI